MKRKLYLKTIYENDGGFLHREDGPAIEHITGRKEYFLNGMRHRVDGPAVIDASGGKSWYWKGLHVSEDEYKKKSLKNNLMDLI